MIGTNYVGEAYFSRGFPDDIVTPPLPDDTGGNSKLVWDTTGNRRFETGLDRGVLYLPNGFAVPWNGLTSIVEIAGADLTPIYFDGMRISNVVSVSDYSATLKAFTYPDEFLEVEGLSELDPGVYASNQMPATFGLSYRTLEGNDSVGTDLGYKLHVVYNLVATPSDTTYATTSDSGSIIEFEWTITAVPVDVPGMRPTAELIFDSREVDPGLLEEIEGLLYGTDTTFAAQPSMSDLLAVVSAWYVTHPPVILITDNGDGTWTATTTVSGLIVDNGDGTFSITDVNAVFAGDSYRISDTDT